MAIKDFKSVSGVVPGKEDEVIRIWMSFGWELKDKQRVKTQDSQQYVGQSSDKSTSYYETTKGVDFFELSFERDPERKNYKELKSLEEQYYIPLPKFNKDYPPEKPKRFGIIFSILIGLSLIVGIFMLIVSFMSSVNGVLTFLLAFIISIALLAPGILIIIFRNKSYSKRLEPWEELQRKYLDQKSEQEKIISDAKKKRSEILEKAKLLV